MYLTAPIYLERGDAHAWLLETLARIAELQRHAKEAHTLAGQDETLPQKVTYTGDVALNNLIKGLVRYVWEGLLKQRATLHWDAYVDGDEAAESPVVCFVSFVLRKLGLRDRDGKSHSLCNLRERIDRLLKQ